MSMIPPTIRAIAAGHTEDAAGHVCLGDHQRGTHQQQREA